MTATSGAPSTSGGAATEVGGATAEYCEDMGFFFTERRWGEPFRQSQRCLLALEGRYGKPTRRYATHAVFELRGP
jgi:hypothetical protein